MEMETSCPPLQLPLPLPLLRLSRFPREILLDPAPIPAQLCSFRLQCGSRYVVMLRLWGMAM